MKIGSGIVIGKDDAAGASAVRKPPEDRRKYEMRLHILLEYITYNMDISILLLGNRSNQSINLIAL
jgi:hypothetical protein